MSGYLGSLLPEVSAEWESRSKARIYRRDPEAWVADVLGSRWHRKQREIGAAFMEHPRILVKSGNGSGKSRQVGELVSWVIATHGIGEALCILSAPTLRQVEQVAFAYLKHNYGVARTGGNPMPGVITDSLEWIWRETPSAPKKTLVLGMKPADRDVVGTFQGIRAIGDKGVHTYVFLDEAGGVPADLFTAAAAVTTGSGNKVLGIGNPDRVQTEMHKIFLKGEEASGWSLHTISVLDLPTITGEIVYPDDPAKQNFMLHESGMNDQAWVDQAARAWGEGSARYKSKVLGEFPDADDFTFFGELDIAQAQSTEIIPDPQMATNFGLDIATSGEDDSALYRADYGTNKEDDTIVGARIRQEDTWSGKSILESTNRGHEAAVANGARDLIVDATGMGEGLFEMLQARAEHHTVIGAKGAQASPDPTRWLNARAYWYDRLREGMRLGKVDLDPADEKLRDEMLTIQYEYTERGQIKIESKKDMRKRGVKSPDELDAVVYSYIDILEMVVGAADGIEKGDVVVIDPWEEFGYSQAGLPI